MSEVILIKDLLQMLIKTKKLIRMYPEKTDNLALFFFKDGIRELKFSKGLNKEELEDFLKIISLDEKELIDDDIVTLLREKDFQYISC